MPKILAKRYKEELATASVSGLHGMDGLGRELGYNNIDMEPGGWSKLST